MQKGDFAVGAYAEGQAEGAAATGDIDSHSVAMVEAAVVLEQVVVDEFKSSRDQSVDPGMVDVMKMIGAVTNCLESFTRRFESPNSRTQSYKDITPNAHDVWEIGRAHV